MEKSSNLNSEQIISAIENMTVLELNELVKSLEDKFGVTASSMMMPATSAVSGAAAPAGAGAEEKSEFDVVLKSVGEQKIQVIKAVREITNLGLKEAKEFVEKPDKPVKEKVSKNEAEEIKKKLESAGATVEIK